MLRIRASQAPPLRRRAQRSRPPRAVARLAPTHSLTRSRVTAGWTIVANTNTAGRIRLSMAGGGSPASGAGVLAYLDFEVIGAPGASSSLG